MSWPRCWVPLQWTSCQAKFVPWKPHVDVNAVFRSCPPFHNWAKQKRESAFTQHMRQKHANMKKKTCLFPRTVSYQNLQVVERIQWQQALWLGLIRPESRQLCNIVSASQSPSCTTAVCCTPKNLGPVGVFFLWNLPSKSFAITPFVDVKGSEDSGDCWMYQMVTSVPNVSRNDGGYNYRLSTVSEEICNCTTNPTSATCTPFNCSFLGFKSFMTWVNCADGTILRKLPPNLCEVLHCTRWKRKTETRHGRKDHNDLKPARILWLHPTRHRFIDKK